VLSGEGTVREARARGEYSPIVCTKGLPSTNNSCAKRGGGQAVNGIHSERYAAHQQRKHWANVRRVVVVVPRAAFCPCPGQGRQILAARSCSLVP
jgi:hypothetical protein